MTYRPRLFRYLDQLTRTTNVLLPALFLAALLLPSVVVAAGPADGATRNKWQARKAHALSLSRPDRAGYVQRLSRWVAPCPVEDARNCTWNADTAGNGVGKSFVDLAGVTFYLNGQVRRYGN